MQAWNIKQLNDKRIEALGLCNNAIAGREIREAAENFASLRKLTPAEVAIAEQFGHRVNAL